MQEELKLRLKTVFEGIEDAERYAEAINDVASAEERAARAIRSSARASEKAAASSAKATEAYRKQAREAASGTTYSMPGPGGHFGSSSRRSTRSGATAGTQSSSGSSTSQNKPIGPHTRLSAAQSALRSAQRAGAPAEVIADHRYRVGLAQKQVERMSMSEEDRDHQRIGDAVLSSRFGAGGFQPLVGRTLKAALSPARAEKLAAAAGRIPGIGPQAASAIGGLASGKASMIVGRLAGPVGAAVWGLGKLASVTKELWAAEEKRVEASSKISADIASGTAAFGTTGKAGVGDMLTRFTGVDSSSASFAYQQRIGSDPIARSYAAQVGVSDMAAPYGSIDPGKGYLKAIKNLAKVDDEFYRRRSARAQGIEQEVERYRLLSPATRKALESAGELTGVVNDKQQMRNAAEFDAADERLKKARENTTQSFDKLNGKTGLQTTIKKLEAWALEKTSSVMEDMHRIDNGSLFKEMGRYEEMRKGGIYDKIKKSGLSAEEQNALIADAERAFGARPGGDEMSGKRTLKDIQAMVDQRISGGMASPGSLASPGSQEQVANAQQAANTQATEKLTQTLQYLNKNIGETLRTQQSAAPSSLRGGNLYDAYSLGALRHGTLG